jgi:uncharacterized membrane protein
MDLGLFDQTIRGYSHFRIVYNTIQMLPNLLAEHFHPLLMVLAPFYWVWSDARMLLILQAVLLALASLPVYALAKERLGSGPALAVQIVFLSFWGMVAGAIYDFHEVALGVPLVAFALFATLRRRDHLLWVTVLLGVLVKENMALIFVALGLYILLVQRRWKLGLALVGVSALAFVVILKIMSSGVLGAPYKFWTYTALGPNAGSAVAHLVRHPLNSLAIAVSNGQKVGLLVALLVPWLLLPLVSPMFLVALPTLAERLLSDRGAYWVPHFHYSLTIAPILAIAMVDAIARLRRRWPIFKRRLLVHALLAMMAVANVPWLINLAPDFGRILGFHGARDYSRCLAKIPKGASVLASNGLVPHLSNRDEIYVIRNEKLKGDYIAVDQGATPELTDKNIAELIHNAMQSGDSVVCSTRQLVVLSSKHSSGTAPLSSSIQNLLDFYIGKQ